MKKLTGTPTKIALYERVLSNDGTELILLPWTDVRDLDTRVAWGGGTNPEYLWVGPWSGYYLKKEPITPNEYNRYLVLATDYDAALERKKRVAAPETKPDLLADLDWSQNQTVLAFDRYVVDDIQHEGKVRAIGSATIIDLLEFAKLCATAREATNRKTECESTLAALLTMMKRAEEFEAENKVLREQHENLKHQVNDVEKKLTNLEQLAKVYEVLETKLLAEQQAHERSILAEQHASRYIESLELRFKKLKSRRANASKKPAKKFAKKAVRK